MVNVVLHLCVGVGCQHEMGTCTANNEQHQELIIPRQFDLEPGDTVEINDIKFEYIA